MRTGISLTELARKIEGFKELKRDFVADTSKLTMQVARGVEETGKQAVSLELEVSDQGRFPILETAHDQIGARLKIPAQYYDRMRTAAPDLLATNVNAWFRLHPERRMLRTLGAMLEPS